MEKGRVLIVDDQEEILTSLGAILADEGHEVLKARDGQDALHIVQSDSPDIVFLDIWIPGIDGLQTLKAIKRIAPKCHVIMMSGHGTIETAVKAIKLGAEDYLEKPLNLEDTLHLVDKAVSSKKIMSEIMDLSGNPGPLIGASHLAANIRRSIENSAHESGSVFIYGEKGSGKEFIARMIHFLSGKDRHKLVKVSCDELTYENLGEVLQGRVSDREPSRTGKLKIAAGGTLLLVGIDRLAPGLEIPLARMLVTMAAGTQKAALGAANFTRLLSTSKKAPEEMISAGFSDEAMNILTQRVIRVPALRERPEDIPLLVRHFLAEASREFDKDIREVEGTALSRLSSHTWPGNIKELKILVEHTVMNTSGDTLTINELLLPSYTKAETKESTWQRTPKVSLASDRLSSLQVSSDLSAQEAASGSGRKPEHRMQKTLRGKVVIYGQGLHSGQKTGLTISPLPPNSGINFGHITSGGTVPALLTFVQSTDFCTSLRGNEAFARTIEHLMAVFHVYGLTNLLVKIAGEVPIMDGSALEFCNLVENAEIITQDEVVEQIDIIEPLDLTLPEGSPKSMRIEPSDAFSVEYHMDYPQPIGKLDMTFKLSGVEDFKSQIAPARTFGFVRDMRMMDEMGLAGGGKLSNVILLDDDKVVNPPLRFQDEYVRHKILDILGDFYLLGRPIVGKIVAVQTGHSENIAMLRLINEKLGIL
jgi:UDP-3-O-acyl N-acetylglucosamine deacetylase